MTAHVDLELDVLAVDHEAQRAIVRCSGLRYLVPLYRTDHGDLTWCHAAALSDGVPRGVVALLDGDADRALARIIAADRADAARMAVYDDDERRAA